MLKFITKSLALIATITLSLVSLSACGTGESEQSTSNNTKVIRVATQRQPHLYAPYIWSQFIPKGYSVTVVPMDNSNDEKDALISGSVDMALMGVPTVIAQASQNGGIKIIAGGADGGSGLVAKSSIHSIAELKGKKIGYVTNSSQSMALRLLLQVNGIDPDNDVQLITISYADMANALQRGDIDAFAGAEMGVSIAKLAGAHVLDSIYDTQIGKVNIALAASDSIIKSDSDLVKAAVSAHQQATAYLTSHTDEWKKGARTQFALQNNVLDSALSNMWLRSDLDDAYQHQCEELAKQMVSINAIKSVPATASFLDTQFVQ